MNILEQIEEAKSQFAKVNGKDPEEISITKKALLDVARCQKMAYYPNEVLGLPVLIWSPTSSELERNQGVPFRLE